MRLLIISILFQILIAQPAFSKRHDKFIGVAKEKGKIVYIEEHDVVFDKDNNVLDATTVYKSPEGKVLGTLKSDFRKSLSMPEHVFVDGRTEGKYGIRRDGDKVILFNQDKGKEEETLVLKDKADKDRVQIGCQGFNYFLKGKIEALKAKERQPVLFMIPGDLDTYRFVLDYKGEDDKQVVEFKAKIESWFLRAFAPSLRFKYDRKIERIVWYKGISNIKSDKGKTMDVEIEYTY